MKLTIGKEIDKTIISVAMPDNQTSYPIMFDTTIFDTRELFNESKCFINQYGELIVIVDSEHLNSDLIKSDTLSILFEGENPDDYITIKRKDAKNIIDMLKNAVVRINDDDDITSELRIFGNSDSFKRLVDAYQKEIYE